MTPESIKDSIFDILTWVGIIFVAILSAVAIVVAVAISIGFFLFGMVFIILMAIINLIPETVKAWMGKK